MRVSASANQTNSHARRAGCCAATHAATSAVAPMPNCPQPGTAVNAEARSIVSRMKRRLSIARSCSAGGSSSVSAVWKVAGQQPCVGRYTPVKLLSSTLQYKAELRPSMNRDARRGRRSAFSRACLFASMQRGETLNPQHQFRPRRVGRLSHPCLRARAGARITKSARDLRKPQNKSRQPAVRQSRGGL